MDVAQATPGHLPDRPASRCAAATPTTRWSTCRPRARPQMQGAGVDYPDYIDPRARVLRAAVAARGAGTARQVHFAPYGSDERQRGAGGQRLRRHRRRRRCWPPRPTRASTPSPSRLRGATTDPYDYVRKVIARVQRDARYTESPPSPGRLAPLDAFLFETKSGYCQHFSGAMALLLRMGGVPARVASGFSPGSRDGAHATWCATSTRTRGSRSTSRGLRLGHLRPDARRLAGALAARRHRGGGVDVGPTPGARSTATGDRLSRSAGAAAPPRPAAATVGVGLVDLAGLRRRDAGARRGRRRRAPWHAGGGWPAAVTPSSRSCAALQRSGRDPCPTLTLRQGRAAARRLRRRGGLRRARCATARYGAGGPPPTPRQRRALRRELGCGPRPAAARIRALVGAAAAVRGAAQRR